MRGGGVLGWCVGVAWSLVVGGALPVRGEARMSAFGLVGVGGAPDP